MVLRPETGMLPRPVIETDRACFECSYNLRGLRVGDLCPECGSVIPRSSFRDNPFTIARPEVIRRFLIGSLAAAGCVVCIIATLWLGFFGVISDQVRSLALLSIGVPWIIAMFLLTPALEVPEAITRGFRKRSWLRQCARWGQLAWLLPAFHIALGILNVNTRRVDDVLSAMSFTGALVGVIATVMLALLLERLAEWVKDDTAERYLQWFQWFGPITLLLLMASGGLAATLSQLLAVLAWALFPVAILMLAKSIALSVEHRSEHMTREDRRRERQQREAAEFDRRIAHMRETHTRETHSS
ncbi:MAG: hypothetical protein ACR2GY_05325 [Phycisphaerales bacterium]